MSSPDQPEKPPGKDTEQVASPGLILPASVLLYGLMAGAALLWLHMRDRSEILTELALGAYGAAASVGIGVAVGGLLIGLLYLGQRYVPPVRRLESRMAKTLSGLRDFEAIGVSLAVALGEELFFRGAMQDAWGFWATVFFYAILNTGPGMLVWGLVSVLSGVVFGLTVAWGGGLLAATLAHALVSYFYLTRLALQKPESGAAT